MASSAAELLARIRTMLDQPAAIVQRHGVQASLVEPGPDMKPVDEEEPGLAKATAVSEDESETSSLMTFSDDGDDRTRRPGDGQTDRISQPHPSCLQSPTAPFPHDLLSGPAPDVERRHVAMSTKSAGQAQPSPATAVLARRPRPTAPVQGPHPAMASASGGGQNTSLPTQETPATAPRRPATSPAAQPSTAPRLRPVPVSNQSPSSSSSSSSESTAQTPVVRPSPPAGGPPPPPPSLPQEPQKQTESIESAFRIDEEWRPTAVYFVDLAPAFSIRALLTAIRVPNGRLLLAEINPRVRQARVVFADPAAHNTFIEGVHQGHFTLVHVARIIIKPMAQAIKRPRGDEALQNCTRALHVKNPPGGRREGLPGLLEDLRQTSAGWYYHVEKALLVEGHLDGKVKSLVVRVVFGSIQDSVRAKASLLSLGAKYKGDCQISYGHDDCSTTGNVMTIATILDMLVPTQDPGFTSIPPATTSGRRPEAPGAWLSPVVPLHTMVTPSNKPLPKPVLLPSTSAKPRPLPPKPNNLPARPNLPPSSVAKPDPAPKLIVLPKVNPPKRVMPKPVVPKSVAPKSVVPKSVVLKPVVPKSVVVSTPTVPKPIVQHLVGSTPTMPTSSSSSATEIDPKSYVMDLQIGHCPLPPFDCRRYGIFIHQLPSAIDEEGLLASIYGGRVRRLFIFQPGRHVPGTSAHAAVFFTTQLIADQILARIQAQNGLWVPAFGRRYRTSRYTTPVPSTEEFFAGHLTRIVVLTFERISANDHISAEYLREFIRANAKIRLSEREMDIPPLWTTGERIKEVIFRLTSIKAATSVHDALSTMKFAGNATTLSYGADPCAKSIHLLI